MAISQIVGICVIWMYPMRIEYIIPFILFYRIYFLLRGGLKKYNENPIRQINATTFTYSTPQAQLFLLNTIHLLHFQQYFHESSIRCNSSGFETATFGIC